MQSIVAYVPLQNCFFYANVGTGCPRIPPNLWSRGKNPYFATLEAVSQPDSNHNEKPISYGIPTPKDRNLALVYFTASRKHTSFCPSSWVIEEIMDQLEDCKIPNHAIRFTLDIATPSRLVEDLVRIHVHEIDANRQ